MGLLKICQRTTAPRETILIRLALAADLLLDGIRAADWHWLIGSSRVERLMPDLPGWIHLAMGYGEIVLAGIIAAGWMTRLAAFLPVALPILMAMVAWSRVQSLQAAQMLDGVVHHGMVALLAIFLVIKGAGPLSIDGAAAMVMRRRR